MCQVKVMRYVDFQYYFGGMIIVLINKFVMTYEFTLWSLLVMILSLNNYRKLVLKSWGKPISVKSLPHR